MVISTPHHTFTTTRLINLSIRTQDIMYREFNSIHPEDQMSDVQRTLARRRSLPVVDAEGKLVGYLSRTDLINARPKRVVLVDHNEQSQAVDGIEEAELLGIIDHHRIADGCAGDLIRGCARLAGPGPWGGRFARQKDLQLHHRARIDGDGWISGWLD